MALMHTAPAAARPGLLRRLVSAQVLRFACVGGASTVLHLGMFAVLHRSLNAQVANLLALVLATLANTAANRQWTFGQGGFQGMARQHLQALSVFLLTWGASAGALAALPLVWHDPSTLVSTVAVGTSMVASTVVRFLAMRHWIFRTA